MLGRLEEMVRHGMIRVKCRQAVDEMASFIWDDKGRARHADGARDDHVMALAIAVAIRPQARYNVRGRAGPLRFPPDLW